MIASENDYLVFCLLFVVNPIPAGGGGAFWPPL